DPTGRLRVGGRRPDGLDRGLLGRYVGPATHHDLGEPGAVADDEERELGQLAPAVHPALQTDGRAGPGGGQLDTECSVGCAWCHDYLQWTEALEVWAGAKSRCHHTFADVSSASRRYAGRADPGLSVIERGLSGLTGVERNRTERRTVPPIRYCRGVRYA